MKKFYSKRLQEALFGLRSWYLGNPSQTAKAYGTTSIRHRSDTNFFYKRIPINRNMRIRLLPMAFAIWDAALKNTRKHSEKAPLTFCWHQRSGLFVSRSWYGLAWHQPARGSMMVADVRGPNRRQAISKHHTARNHITHRAKRDTIWRSGTHRYRWYRWVRIIEGML